MRRRKHDTGLPERVYPHHGGFRYLPPQGKPVNLGRDRAAALLQYDKLIAESGAVAARPGAKLAKWIAKYKVDVFPKLAPATQRTRRAHFMNLEAFFGDMLPDDVVAIDVYAYKDMRKSAPGQANGEIGTLSALYTQMIEWGGATKNPCFRLKKFKKGRRRRVPSIAELSAFVALATNPLVPLYIQMKLAWGLRKKDILDLPRIAASAEYHDIEVSKSMRWSDEAGRRVGEMRRLMISPSMRELLRQIHALPGRAHIRSHLFSPTRGKNRGKRYTDNGFDCLLGTVHAAFVAAGGKRFHEHDIRASTATLDPANAKRRLGHKDQSTTDIYLRAFDIDEVQPLEVSLTRKVT